ncbi:MAG: cyclic peptide export ABC transporter [Desulfobacterales bacterium]|nr:cyclic peptide export ABC transporter [Desulfobacterales bacterium]
MEFLTYLRNIHLKSAYNIILLSFISGISGGALIILYPNAAIHIFDPNNYLFYLFVLPITSSIFIFSKRFSQKKTNHAMEENLEDTILSIANTIRHDELSNFEKRNRADIYLSIVNAQNITQAAAKSIDALEHKITLIIGWIYIFVFLSSFFGWVILIWRLLIILLRETFQTIIKSIIFEEMKAQKDLFKIFETHLYGFKELKFNKKKCDEIFEHNFKLYTEKIKVLRNKSSFYLSELQLIYSLSIFLLIGCGVFLLFPTFSSETALKIVIMMLCMMKTDIMILNHIPYILEGKATLERLQKLFPKNSLKAKDQNLFSFSKESIKEIKSISLKDVKFSYPSFGNESGFSVEIDNLNIKSGEILFIVGGNGSGKSTFINILTGLYRHKAGEIKINDHIVQMAEHRYLFSSIFTDFHLFNSLYGMEGVTDERVNELLKMMNIYSKTQCKKGHFNTINLSSGQKKRLALVLAILEDKPIYIFDEWAADQDPHFRRYFYEKVLPMLKEMGKMIIVITHDEHYFHTADNVIRMEYGKIVDRFNPQKVIPSIEKHETEKNYSKGITQIQRRKRKLLDKDMDKHPKNIAEQIKQMMGAHGTLIKKLISLLALVSLSIVFIFVVILSTAKTSTQSKTILFIQFMALIILYAISFRRLNRQFYKSLEDKIADFRIGILDRIRKTSLQTIEQIGVGRIYTKLTSDVKAIADTSLSILMTLIGVNRTLISFLYIAFIYFPAFIIMISLTFIGAMFYFYNHSLILTIFSSLRERERQLFESINDLLKGFKELLINNKKSDDFYLKSIKQNTLNLREIKLSFSSYYTNNYTIAYAMWEGMLLSITLLLPFLENSSTILPITVAMIVTIPLNQIVDRYSHFHTAYMSLKQLYQFEDEIKDVQAEEEHISHKIDLKELKYENCTFIYKSKDGHPFYLGPLNVSFKAGEIVFITGGNGSGKSTLLKLITGLYPKDSGEIFVNNKKVDIKLFQELFSVIFSDFYLFDRLYGMEKVDETKLKYLLEQFQLNKIVKYTDGEFNTLDLSTGQKKRLALIITILEDKPIYVFDEWAADQDPLFREYFYKSLLPEFKAQGKTVIAVTHDDRFFSAADRIIKIDYGQIV